MFGRLTLTPMRTAAIAGCALLAVGASQVVRDAGPSGYVLAEIGAEKGVVSANALRLFLAAQAAVARSTERQAVDEASVAFATDMTAMTRGMDLGAEAFAAWRGSWLTKLSLTATAARAFATATAVGDGSPKAASEAAVMREVSEKFSELAVHPEESGKLVSEAAAKSLAVVDRRCIAAASDATRATTEFVQAVSVPGASANIKAILEFDSGVAPEPGHVATVMPEPDIGAEFALWAGGLDAGSAAWELVSGGAAWMAMVAATPAVTAAMTTVGAGVATGVAVLGAGALAPMAAPLFFAAGLGFAGVASYSVETAAGAAQTADIAAASKAAIAGLTTKIQATFRPRIENRARNRCGELANKLSAAFGGQSGASPDPP